MKILNLIVLLSLVTLYTSCQKSTEPIETDKPLPGYQEDIPWPSIADSPWPIHHGDPQNTGRSDLSGPITGSIRFSLDSVVIGSGPTIGPDSIFYFVSTGIRPGFFAYDYDGRLKWQFPLANLPGDEVGTPLIAANKTIYFNYPPSGNLYAINPDGSLKWKIADRRYVGISLNIGLDGVLYIFDENRSLLAIDQNGTIKWEFPSTDFFTYTTTFSTDGKTIYILGSFDKGVYAVDIQQQQIKWSFGIARSFASPVVDAKGNIYVIASLDSTGVNTHGLYALDEDGQIKWSYKFGEKDGLYYSPTIDKIGNLYFGGRTLHSVDYQGNFRWKVETSEWISSPLVCDNNSNIYSTTIDWDNYKVSVVSYDSEGNLLWESIIHDYREGFFSPAIGHDNTLIIAPLRSNFIHAIK